MKRGYNVQALLDMAQEYLNAENEYQLFLLTWEGGWVPSMDPVKYGSYVSKDSARSHTYDALRSACKVVSADISAVISMAKAMSRYEKRRRWQVCAHLPSGWCRYCGEDGDDRVRRFFSVPDEWSGYFRSTGRRQPWAS